MDRGGIVILTSVRTHPSGSKRRKKAKEAKMREEEVPAKSRNIQGLFHSGSEVQRRQFCGTCERIENRRTCCDRLRST